MKTNLSIFLIVSVVLTFVSCQQNSSRRVKIYKLVNNTITDTLSSFYHLTQTKTGWEELVTGRPRIDEDETILIDFIMYWNTNRDTPLLDLEESCLIMLALPDTVQTEKGEIVIREYLEECGPIDGLVTFYHSAALGPVAAVYGHGRIDVFEYPGYEEITSYIVKKIHADEPLSIDEIDSIYESAPIYSDTLILNGHPFIKQSKDGRFYCLLNPKGDTSILSEDFYHEAEVIDIDQNGFMDLSISIMSNDPNQRDNYLFDPILRTFRKIENCYQYVEKIKGTAYYYSYNRAGCADADWESHLSKIINYQLIDFGYMHGQGCRNPQIIEIFNYASPGKEEKTKIATLSYAEYIKNPEHKWPFIKEYWVKNYRKFE